MLTCNENSPQTYVSCSACDEEIVQDNYQLSTGSIKRTKIQLEVDSQLCLANVSFCLDY